MGRVIASVAAGLASLSIGVSAAHAQGGGAAQGQSVTVTFATPPTRTITVVTFGLSGVVSTAKAGPTPGTFVLPSKDFAVGTAVEIWRIRCQDTRQVGVMNPLVALPANCEKSTNLGKGTWTPGASLAAAFPPPPGGVRFSPYALGGINFTYTTGIGDAVSDIDDLFSSIGVNADTTSDALDFGWQFGGGVRMSWSRRFPAIDVSYLYANVGGPSIGIAITDPFAPGVEFDIDSNLRYALNSLRFGAKFRVLPSLYVTPMASYSWWNLELATHVEARENGEILGEDTLHLDDSSSDWGFGARVDYKLPALRKVAPLSIYGEVMLHLMHGENSNIFGENELPPWPADHKLLVFSIGVKYEIPFRWRVGGNAR